MRMIASDDMPEEVLQWIKEHSAKVGDDVIAVNTVIIMYDALDSEGDPYWNYRVMGDLRAIRVAGLLELVKLRLLTPHIRQGLEEGRDD